MHRSCQRQGLCLRILLGVVVANYLAQMLYYLHLYYFPRGALPSVGGALLLGLTFVGFLLDYVGVGRGRGTGNWLLLACLVAEVGFYVKNLLTQVLHGYAPFFHLQTRDPILFVVFGIGYLNLLVGGNALSYLRSHRRTLIASGTIATQ